MLMVVFDSSDRVLGSCDLRGTAWTMNGNSFENSETIRVPITKAGVPDYFWLKSENGEYNGRHSFERQLPRVGTIDMLYLRPGNVRWGIFPRESSPIYEQPQLPPPTPRLAMPSWIRRLK